MKKIFSIIFLFVFLLNSYSADKFTLSGHVKDPVTGEDLIGVGVYIPSLKRGIVTNTTGVYSLSLDKGTYEISFSYVGYKTLSKKVVLTDNKTLNIELQHSETVLKGVEVSGRKPDANVTDLSMSVQKIPILTIKRMPALMGEVDVIKSIQLLPGVQAAAEGTSGFSVRGGGVDQNLILLDDATVYNASHLMGFFSVFNSDAIQDATLYKGDIPAMYGGRLSSVLDVSMREGDDEKYKVSGGIGLIASRLAIEGPIVKGKSSFIISGRRTYADVFLPLSSNKALRSSSLYFYDLNAKFNYTIDNNNRIYGSGYWGRDNFGTSVASLNFGNGTADVRWNHLFSKTLFSNLSLIESQYTYGINMNLGTVGIQWKAGLEDYGLKYEFVDLLNDKNTIRFGLSSNLHVFQPGQLTNTGTSSLVSDSTIQNQKALEHAVYLSNEEKISRTLSVKYGLRASAFQNMGQALVYTYDKDFNKTDSTKYSSGQIYHTYYGLEPRFGLVWLLPYETSFKASYSRTMQYIQLGSNSTGGLPFNLWFPANPNIKPESSNQYAIGLFKNFFDNSFETSIEGYYKTISNLVDFKDNADLIGNPYIETQLLTGKGRSYGVEMLIRKNVGKLSGWLSYTYSRSFCTVDGINFDKEYSSPYDRPNDFVAVLSYDFTQRINFSTNFIYCTGQPVTYPFGKFEYGNVLIPVYSGERNTYRYPDYNRMDVSLTIKGKQKKHLPWRDEWNFSIYNVYARKNAWAVTFVQDKQNPNIMETQMIYLFSFIPSVTYNFYF